ncbi:MAG: hypothetical protein LBI17_00890 [Rickettsiales bacterium]|nr:hypothetical protein [Rickettsiales bacterium]
MNLPQATEFLLSHRKAEDEFFKSFKSGRFHHSWLIAGPRGIGKATLAYRIARYLFSRGSPDLLKRLNLKIAAAPALESARFEDDEGDGDGLSVFGDFEAAPAKAAPSGRLAELDGSPLKVSRANPVFGRMLAGGITDFRVVEREWADAGKTRRRTEITVDQIRGLKEFFSVTASEDGYRVGLVDSVDEMNANAANALLKILEEPPDAAVLLLVCHGLGGILPTIKSRCRILKLSPVGADDMRDLLGEYLPDVPAADIERLIAVSGGSVGGALSMHSLGGLALFGTVSRVASEMLAGRGAGVLEVVDRVGGREDMFAIFKSAFSRFADGAIRLKSGLEVGPASVEEKAALEALAARAGCIDSLFRFRDGVLGGFDLAASLNLDITASVASAFERLRYVR